jgi:hypothetical protein
MGRKLVLVAVLGLLCFAGTKKFNAVIAAQRYIVGLSLLNTAMIYLLIFVCRMCGAGGRGRSIAYC